MSGLAQRFDSTVGPSSLQGQTRCEKLKRLKTSTNAWVPKPRTHIGQLTTISMAKLHPKERIAEIVHRMAAINVE